MQELRNAFREYRAGSLFLAAGFALCVAYFLTPTGTAQNDIYDLIGVASSFAIVLGVWVHRPEYPLPWYLFAVLASSCVWTLTWAVLFVRIRRGEIGDGEAGVELPRHEAGEVLGL